MDQIYIKIESARINNRERLLKPNPSKHTNVLQRNASNQRYNEIQKIPRKSIKNRLKKDIFPQCEKKKKNYNSSEN